MEFDFISELTRFSIILFIGINFIYFSSKFINWLVNAIIGVLHVKD